MPEPIPTFDRDLQRQHVVGLADADAVAAFFAHLGYPGVERIAQVPENLGISAESTLRPIRRIELIADLPGEFQVYLFEVKSVTVSHRKALVRAFRDLAGKFLLVVTADFERLDFVLVDTPRGEAAEEDSPFGRKATKVLPRVHTVDRRRPDVVNLRVLRRFTWTEEDGYSQHEKLRSAFDLATWSEPEFNNRALFSDHYLKSRLPGLIEDWREGPKSAYQALSRLFRMARSRTGQSDLDSLRRELLDPALAVLGFRAGAPVEKDRTLGRPLFGPDTEEGESTPPLAWCLDVPWGRSLDAKDPVRDPQEPELNPSVRVVDLLDRDDVGVPWIILTNGQIWRLYGRQAHSRATNYYEIDAEEVVSATSGTSAAPQEPFRYFWFLFRRQAFEPQPRVREGREVHEPLLTHVWVESGEYAKRLGNRLKDKVFDEVFEILARGFLDSRTSEQDPSQSELDEAFEGTLIFLYRLLFLLYAEARDLLPVREIRGYHPVSLTRLRREVAKTAGPALSHSKNKLEEAYANRGSYAFYERLLHLYRIVDKGDPAVNVPKYNGGLFVTDPHEEDSRSEARAARFLRNHLLADRPTAAAKPPRSAFSRRVRSTSKTSSANAAQLARTTPRTSWSSTSSARPSSRSFTTNWKLCVRACARLRTGGGSARSRPGTPPRGNALTSTTTVLP